MKIDIINRDGSCEPCNNLIEAIQDFIEEYSEINLTYEIYINNTTEGQIKKQEHINRGLPWIGSPTWILYDDDGNYKNTFLGFIGEDRYADRVEIFKNIILEESEMIHPTENFIISPNTNEE
jgi:hypothetical protein